MRARIATSTLLALGLLLGPAGTAGRADPAACLGATGRAGERCLERFAGAVEKCRKLGDPACEEAVRADGGTLSQALGSITLPVVRKCDADDAFVLGYTSLSDVPFRIAEACQDFAEDHLALAWAEAPGALAPGEMRCQARVARELARVRKKTVRDLGRRCNLRSFRGLNCRAERRDARVLRWSARAKRRILRRCGADFAALGLGDLDALVETVATRARHYALRVFPPNDLGPSGAFGPYPIGVRTLLLHDPTREDLGQPGAPRPVKVEVYYPTTEAAVAGIPGDVIRVFGVDLVETPSYRDVERAPGEFPVVLFSHGNGGIRFQSFFLTAHLASHGFLVVSPDHHGNTFLDALAGLDDSDAAVNRPLDMSFLVDQLVALDAEEGSFLEGAVDENAIGMSGHSFGGYTAFALAGGAFGLGTFTDPRIRAILPLAPAAGFFDAAFFSTVGVPTLVVGGSLDETTPFATDQQAPYDALPTGALVVGLAELAGAGHFTFSDFCEVPRQLLAALGGFEEACEPRHLPWRHAHDLIDALATDFFRATLAGDAEALGRLTPEARAGTAFLRLETK